MRQTLIHVALIVRDYDEAIDFYCKKLHFSLVEDTYQPGQEAFIGNQAGRRVCLFLGTDDFWRDYNEMRSAGINLWDLIELTRTRDTTDP